MTEKNHYLYIKSPLGPDALKLQSFEGSEGISQIFCFQLELLSENKAIKFEEILGKEISFGVLGPESGEPPRHIHGIVTAFARLEDTGRLSKYRAIVSPKLWILTRKQNCRIFQNLAVSDILKKLLEGLDVTWELQVTYKPRDYCVQYRETDFNFLSRLMEEEGIFYFFRHTEEAHKLVVADNKASHKNMPDKASLIYEGALGGVRDESRVSSWVKTQEFGPGKCSVKDYCFEDPQTNLFASQDIRPSTMVGKVSHSLKVGGNDQLEIYDYPGRYENKDQGKDAAKHAIEQMEMSQFLIQGKSNIYQLIPGYRFSLVKHPHADGMYIVTSATHKASEGGLHSGEGASEAHYSNTFTSIPFSLLFSPPRTADKPHVWGCQTAVVVGPSGEEIYADKYGRVKVQFHWDREGQRDQSSSCWIRVATPLAGEKWGTVHLPRIGQEVVVDFLEGDPDRPIIIGSVYNALHMPPYDLPANKTQSGIITESSQGGGGHNQIRFEDLKGSEEILIHAQKDMNAMVENDVTVEIKNKRTTTVGNNETIEVKNNRTTKVKKDDKTIVGKKMHLMVNGNSIAVVKGKESRKIMMGRKADVSGSDKLTVKGSASISAASLTIKAATITLNAGIVKVSGVLQCSSVVSTSYSPGAGNTM